MVGLSSLVAMVLSGVICAGASFLLVTLDVHGGLDKDGFNGAKNNASSLSLRRTAMRNF